MSRNIIFVVTRYMNVNYAADHERLAVFSSMCRVYSVSTDNIFTWICDVFYII
jgi:hypothetical protein